MKTDAVRIIEVGPRDGLQNEKTTVSPDMRATLVRDLIDAGAREVEIGSFVSPKWVPQMAGTDVVQSALRDETALAGIALVPNIKGLEQAIDSGVSRIAIFPAATESFSKRNLNVSRADSFTRSAEVARAALDAGLQVRGYISVAFHCPFEGWVDPQDTLDLTARLLDLGCYEVSICDTTGAASPGHVARVMTPALDRHGPDVIVGHFHDTYDQGIANALWSWQLGVRAFDASVGGLGGCPYSPGATGNIATEALVHMFEGLNVETGLDKVRLIQIAERIWSQLGRKYQSGFRNASDL